MRENIMMVALDRIVSEQRATACVNEAMRRQCGDSKRKSQPLSACPHHNVNLFLYVSALCTLQHYTLLPSQVIDITVDVDSSRLVLFRAIVVKMTLTCISQRG